MKDLKQLQQELKGLQIALKNKDISVNEYCDFYHSISKMIKDITI